MGRTFEVVLHDTGSVLLDVVCIVALKNKRLRVFDLSAALHVVVVVHHVRRYVKVYYCTSRQEYYFIEALLQLTNCSCSSNKTKHIQTPRRTGKQVTAQWQRNWLSEQTWMRQHNVRSTSQHRGQKPPVSMLQWVIFHGFWRRPVTTKNILTLHLNNIFSLQSVANPKLGATGRQWLRRQSFARDFQYYGSEPVVVCHTLALPSWGSV